MIHASFLWSGGGGGSGLGYTTIYGNIIEKERKRNFGK
jgi:hypothetical protein